MRPNLLVIRAADMDGLADFYSNLGCVFTKHRHGKGPEHYAYETEDFVFEIYSLQDNAIATTGVRLGFKVKSVDDALAIVRQTHAAKVISEAQDSPWGRRAVIDDPAGHRVELTE